MKITNKEMKLYTEEEVIALTKAAFTSGLNHNPYIFSEELKNITPIEIPSDEDIIIPFPSLDNVKRYIDGKELKTWMEGWEDGYKRARVDVLNKIQGGNK